MKSKIVALSKNEEFKTLLKETNIDMTEPSASSFRILVPERLTPYYMGIRKICICINLETNTNILERLRDRRFILEVSIHDEEENYLGWKEKGYTKDRYIKFFEEENFEKNISDIATEVYDILTYQCFPEP